MSVGSASTSIAVYDILTRMIPGAVFLTLLALLVSVPTSGLPNMSGTYTAILFLISALVLGEIFNSIRLSMYDVPSHFRRIFFTQNEDTAYLNWLDRFFANKSEIIAEDLQEQCIFDNKSAVLLNVVRERFDLPEDFRSHYDTYNLIISDLSGKETRRTQRLRSVYILTKNLRIALVALLLLSITVGIYSLIDSGIALNPQAAIAFMVVFFALILVYFVEMIGRGVASIDTVYVESLLNDYFTLIYGR